MLTHIKFFCAIGNLNHSWNCLNIEFLQRHASTFNLININLAAPSITVSIRCKSNVIKPVVITTRNQLAVFFLVPSVFWIVIVFIFDNLMFSLCSLIIKNDYRYLKIVFCKCNVDRDDLKLFNILSVGRINLLLIMK